MAQTAWREAQQALLLPIPYFHLVFTVPHELAFLWPANYAALGNLLFQCARDALFEHFTNEQIVELTLVVAIANFTNRFNNGLSLEPEA